MLIKTNVLNFTELGKSTIEEAQATCIKDFYEKLLDFQYDIKEISADYSIKNYEYFNNKFAQGISYNNKNEQFKTVLTGVREYCLNTAKRGTEELQDVVKVSECDNAYRYNKKYMNKCIDICEVIEREHLGNKVKTTILETMFGAGEFPFLVFKIVRIGNNNYYFYEISR